MDKRPAHVLFLCTGNSARSILAEALANHLGRGRLRGYSAGSHPRGMVAPEAVAVLARHGVPVDGLHAKGFDAFTGPDAPRFDLVVTVCDAAARQPCPVWPGAPATVAWSLPDPAAAPPAGRERAFESTFDALRLRIEALAVQGPDAGPAELATAAACIHEQFSATGSKDSS